MDVVINPEIVCEPKHITRLIQNPGALQVLVFQRVFGIKATLGCPLVGHEIAHLRKHLPHVDTRVAAIYRKDRCNYSAGEIPLFRKATKSFHRSPPQHSEGDGELQPADKPYRRVMIAGGNIGARLANAGVKFQVKLIEHNQDKCMKLSEDLNRTIVLHGNSANKELLLEENIEETDVFCAVTNDDEANIMASMQTKRLGVRKVMTLINNPDYVDLIQRRRN